MLLLNVIKITYSGQSTNLIQTTVLIESHLDKSSLFFTIIKYYLNGDDILLNIFC